MANTLQISWAAVTPAPSLGYRVKYWPVSNPSNILEVNPYPTTNSATITNLSEVSYAGTVEAACGGGNFSTPQSFTASIAGAAASLATVSCSNGIGSYTLTGTAGHIVRVRLAATGFLQPTQYSTAWLAIALSSSSPSFSASATSSCYTASGGVSLGIEKNITIPAGGTVTLGTSCWTHNSTASMMSVGLTILSVNGGANSSNGTTSISGVCIYNSSTGGSCPGPSNTGD